MSDLIPIQAFANPVEAELAKNALEAAGIPAMVTANGEAKGVGVDLVVTAQDEDRAKEILKGSEQNESDLNSEELDLMEQQKKDQDQAAKEFEEMKTEALISKAASAKSAGILGLMFLAGVPLSFIFFGDSSLKFRIGGVCLLFAIIQFFVWKDAIAAGKQISKEE